MISTLLAMFGGGLMRILPEVLALFNKKTDNSHELAMMDKQIELQKLKGANDIATLQAQGEEARATALTEGEVNLNLKQLDAIMSALQGQMQKTGIWFVDVLNFLVRPATTYYFLGMYGLVKVSMVVIACQQTDAWLAIVKCWTAQDDAILSGILAFWFVGRVFDKRK